MSNKINIITLGCSKNLADSERLATYLKNSGNKIVFEGDINAGRTAIINTCGFIGDAKEESISTIFDFVEAKSKNKIDKVIVMGCLTERYKDNIKAEIPELDGIFGVNDLKEILAFMHADYTELYGERMISTPSHYAYLKIAEGCNRSCSFCAIPAIRGKHISYPIEKLSEEANYLTQNGIKEILLISQDTSFYGKDLYNDFALRKLLDNLLKINKLEWLRLHYLYPGNFLDSVLDLMAENRKLCKYIDIPFQHISSKILKSMRRGHNEEFIKSSIDMFRKKVPEVALRTTMIVGYPNESDKDFQELVDFVETTKFDRLGVFAYSEEEGTKAATLPDTVPTKVKQERLEHIMSLQSAISLEKNIEKTGKTFKVIIDKEENDYYIGRTEFDSPEVDNEVLINKDKKLEIGNFYPVKITSAVEFDLFGEVVTT